MKRMEERKRLPVSLQEQLSLILRDHITDALPPSKTRNRRQNGQGVPLTAWMRGAMRDAPSRIFSVVGGTARYPFKHWGGGTADLAYRIGSRYDVTWVQQDLILGFVYLNYRGRDPDCCTVIMGTVNKPIRNTHTLCGVDAIRDACEKLKISPLQLPLRALICERVTNIILLMQLNETLKRA